MSQQRRAPSEPPGASLHHRYITREEPRASSIPSYLVEAFCELRQFSEVRRAPILCLAPHCLDYAPGRALRRDYRDLAEPGHPQQLPVLLAVALLPATEKHQHVEVHQGETHPLGHPLGRIRVVLRGEYLL